MSNCKFCGKEFIGRRMSGHVTGCPSNPNAYHKKRTEAEFKAANKAKVYAYRARQYKAILPTTDLHLIKKIYLLCPEGYTVDHIVALAAGGPHHQDNLQYLPISENCRKGKNNKYDESLAVRWQERMRDAHDTDA